MSRTTNEAIDAFNADAALQQEWAEVEDARASHNALDALIKRGELVVVSDGVYATPKAYALAMAKRSIN